MNFEQPQEESPGWKYRVPRSALNPDTIKSKAPNQRIYLKNIAQLMLAERFAWRLHTEPDNQEETDWMSTHSTAFRELLAREPDLLDRFQADPETTLVHIEAELYGGEELKEAA